MRRDLYVRDGRGRYRKATQNQIISKAIEETRSLFKQRFSNGTMTCPEKVVKYLTPHMSMQKRERFVAMFLDNRHHILKVKTMHKGTIGGTYVTPRETARLALRWNAAAVVVAHNHPSGNPSPSRDDEVLTAKLRDALELVGVNLIDHIVFGGGDYMSMSDMGLM